MPTEPYIPNMSPELVEASTDAKARALRIALKAGLLGLGGGAGLAALLGLPHLIKHKPPPSYPSQPDVELPYPQEVAKTAGLADEAVRVPLTAAMDTYLNRKKQDGVKHPESGARSASKSILAGIASVPFSLGAGALGQAVVAKKPWLRWKGPKIPLTSRRAGFLSGERLIPSVLSSSAGSAAFAATRPLAGAVVDRVMDGQKRADWASRLAGMMSPAPGSPTPTSLSPAWARGDTQVKPLSVPWAAPAIGAAAVGGLYGGHELVRYALRKKRKSDLDKDLQAAEKEYDEAMLSQYDPTKLRHLSAVKEASASAIDFCFDQLTANQAAGKQAAFDDALGGAAGLYGLGALALGGATGLGTYRWLRGRSADKRFRDALKRRAMLRNLQSPPSLYVRPVPVEYVAKTDEEPTK